MTQKTHLALICDIKLYLNCKKKKILPIQYLNLIMHVTKKCIQVF